METKQKIRNFIEDNFLTHLPDFELDDDQSLMDSDIVDSTGVIELITFIGDEFKIEIPDEDILPRNFDSVNRITGYIIDRQNGKIP